MDMQDKVASRSMDGLKLRRHLLRGAVVVFVTAGYSGKKFIFDKVGSESSSSHALMWIFGRD